MDDEELHEQLHSSAKENLPRTAEDLLRSLADVNHRDPLGYTALHTSCSRGFIQVAQLLQIHPQISLNLQTPDGWTALHLACMNGKGNAVKLLLRDSRVEVNLADKLGCSPLWYAAQGGHMEVVHWLLASGRKFDLGLKGKGMGRPLTAVQVARMIEREDLAALLEEYEADFTAVVGKLRQLLEITDFPVSTLPILTQKQYEEYLTNGTVADLPLALLLKVPLSPFATTIPGIFNHPSEVKYLSLAGSKLTLLPEVLADLFQNLIELDLSENTLANLPDFLGQLPKLHTLHLANNHLRMIPGWLAKFRPKSILNFSYNPLSSDDIILVSSMILQSDAPKIDLTAVPFTAVGIIPLFNALAEKFQKGFTFSSICVDEFFLDSFSGLACIPIEILKEGSQKIASYLTTTPVPERTVNFLQEDSLDLSGCRLVSIPDFVWKSPALKNLDLSANPLSANDIASFLVQNKRVTRFKLTNIPFEEDAVHTIIEALVTNFGNKNFVLEFFEMDNFIIPSFNGLGIIPVDIMRQGTKATVQYLLDLYRSPEANPLYRSKLMVVGFENVGKTTILDCVFPIEGVVLKKVNMATVERYHKLQGNVLTRWKGSSEKTTQKKPIFLENRQWQLTSHPPFGIRLTPIKKKEDGEVEFFLQNKETYDAWFQRLKRICMNEATHGIEIQQLVIQNNVTKQFFKGKEGGSLELSVWDFAGQHDYYNNHQYFLSSRTVFLILWRISEGTEGLKGLAFWLQSLATHLHTAHSKSDEGTYFSVLVVGTYLDHPSVVRADKIMRAQTIDKMATDCGLQQAVQYFEVSCSSTQENIDVLQDAIFSTTLNHSYMGERIPKSYLTISEFLKAHREKALANKLIPTLNTDVIFQRFGEELSKRALALLSLWGECVYFSSPPELASMVVLDPRFLTKGIMADLFSHDPNIQAMRKDGVLRHSDLVHIWKQFVGERDFAAISKSFISLLQMFSVCFVVEEDKHKPFMEQRSIIPALLPPREVFFSEDDLVIIRAKQTTFDECWPQDPPFDRSIEIERALFFNVIPMELIGRLLIRFHSFIQAELVWRDEVLIFNPDNHTQAWIRISSQDNSLCVSLRGISTEACIQLMSVIVSGVTTICANYSGVRFFEAVRSPHSLSALITTEDLKKDLSLPEDHRQLRCPETHFPLKAEILFSIGGYIQLDRSEKAEFWETAFPETNSGKLREPLISNGVSSVTTQFFVFTEFLAKLGGNEELRGIQSASLITNPFLRLTLKNSLQLLQGKLADTKSLFQKEDWRQGPNIDVKQETLFHLADFIATFRSRNWNNGAKPALVPMVQKLPEKLAWLIAQHGFGFLPQTEGYMGRGYYFTNSIKHLNQSSPADKDDQKYVYLMSLVAPGNPFPVVEVSGLTPLTGRTCRPGYQSHYAVIQGQGNLKAGELAIFDPGLALPLFMWGASEPANSELVRTSRPELSLSLDSSWKFESSKNFANSEEIVEAIHSLLHAQKSKDSAPFEPLVQRLKLLFSEFITKAAMPTLDISSFQEREALLGGFSKATESVLQSLEQHCSQLQSNTPFDPNELYEAFHLIRGLIEKISELNFFRCLSFQETLTEPVWWRYAIPATPSTISQGILVPVYEKGQVKNHILTQKLASLLPFLGENLDAVNKAYWIDNSILATLFEGTLESIRNRHQMNPHEFNRKSWKYAKEHKRRGEIIQRLDQKIADASAIVGPRAEGLVIPVIQGTSENAAHRIAKNGFGTVSSLDPGWYGQGMYTTTSFNYAGNYASEAKDGFVFLISLVTIGNAFPVIDPPFVKKTLGLRVNPTGQYGKPCQLGYQSHYCVVETEKTSLGKPVKDSTNLAGLPDEVVVFEPTQILPLFLIHSSKYYLKPNGSSVYKEWL